MVMLSFEEWLILTLTCLAGAASPGPSVVILIHSVTSTGVMAGVMFGLAHGFGILIYAGLVSIGLASLLLFSPLLFISIQVVGVGFLIWIGANMIRAGLAAPDPLAPEPLAPASPYNSPHTSDLLAPHPYWQHARDGFLIAFLNPKVAVFFSAVFSQFLTAGQPILMRVQMTATAWAVDTLWYILLAFILGLPIILRWFRQYANRINLIMGCVLIILASVIAISLVA